MIVMRVPGVLKFLAVGLINTLIGLSVIYAAMFLFGFDPFLSNAIGYSVGLFFGYLLNKKWTFKHRKKSRASLAVYLFVIAISYFVNIALVYIGIYFFEINYYGAQFVGMISYAAISYIGCKELVFNRPVGEI